MQAYARGRMNTVHTENVSYSLLMICLNADGISRCQIPAVIRYPEYVSISLLLTLKVFLIYPGSMLSTQRKAVSERVSEQKKAV